VAIAAGMATEADADASLSELLAANERLVRLADELRAETPGCGKNWRAATP